MNVLSKASLALLMTSGLVTGCAPAIRLRVLEA